MTILKQVFMSAALAFTAASLWAATSSEIADPDNGKEPPDGITLALRDKTAMEIPNGYYWRAMMKLRREWEAQRPQGIPKDWYIEIHFLLDENGELSDISVPDALLDTNARKALRAFLNVTWEKWSDDMKIRLKHPVRLDVSFVRDASSPNQTPEPTAPSGRGSL